MPFNLIDAAKGLLPNDLLSKAAGSLGESEGGIQKALSGAIPSVLAGLLGQSSGSGATGILDMVKNAAGSGVLNNISGLIGGGGAAGGVGATVMGWLRSLFGDKLNSVISAIAGFAGIKSASASSVLSMAAPAALGSVGQYASENNLSASGLSSFLQSQKSSILSSIPSGFNLAGALGLSSLGDIGGKISGAISSATSYTSDAVKKGNKSWLWIIILLVAALLIWLLTSKGCNQEKAVTPAVVVDSPLVTPPAAVTPVYMTKGRLDSISGDFIYDAGDMTTISLPNNGGDITVGKWSTEARLVEFLTNSSASIDTVKGNWFDFTNVRFKTGGTTITPESSTQLKNLVMIIKAFPNARFKIGGYTDNTGDAARNRALSQKRAEAVAAEITKLGASASQLTKAEGYGDLHPVGDNNTAEGKAMNRRVSVNVKAK
jgi:outer membrane protein OmpA-like peptidoglycan-associated protein